MPDWTGTCARREALTVPCPDCHARTDEQCVRDDGRPLVNLPAHPRRMREAKRKNQHQPTNPNRLELE